MPRPPVKRRKYNSFTTSPAHHKHRRGSKIPDQNEVRAAHEKKLAAKPVGKRPHDSDDSDNLVTSRTGGVSRGRRKQEIYASGAVAKGDKPGAWPTKAQRTRAMREDTEEILSQRSRSASRANSTASDRDNHAAPKTSATVKPTPAPAPASRREKPSAQATVTRPRPNGVSQIPHADVSVLGKLKPRKRQASILQLIENEDGHDTSSSFSSDDDPGFSPDSLSTPFATIQTDKTDTANSASSLKRKRGTDVVYSAFVGISPVRAASAQKAQTALVQPTRAQQRRLEQSTNADATDDIMAPPESSDEEHVAKGATAVMPGSRNKTKTRRPEVLSTEQLQGLMPSKKHYSATEHRVQNGDFEIPADSFEDESEDEHDVSNFVPGKRGKAQKRPVAKKASKEVPRVGGKTRTKIKDQSKSTRTTSYTPSPVRLRTPRPLSSAVRGTEAKSPSKQGAVNVMRDRTTNTTLPNPRDGAKKQYGGSRVLRNTAAGKENQQVVLLSDGSPSSSEDAVGAPRPTKRQRQTAEEKAWTKKWADIDNFSLDFEDVSASTRSSSPMAR